MWAPHVRKAHKDSTMKSWIWLQIYNVFVLNCMFNSKSHICTIYRCIQKKQKVRFYYWPVSLSQWSPIKVPVSLNAVPSPPPVFCANVTQQTMAGLSVHAASVCNNKCVSVNVCKMVTCESQTFSLASPFPFLSWGKAADCTTIKSILRCMARYALVCSLATRKKII